MSHRCLVSSVMLLAAALAPAAAQQIVFGPVRSQPGQSIRLLSHAETPGGTITKQTLKGPTTGSFVLTRDRDLIWTFRPETEDGTRRGMVKVNAITTHTVIKHGNSEEPTDDNSPLNGKMFAISKTKRGDWKFELDGTLPERRIRKDITELTTYLKRKWFPEHAVSVGDSWEFDPTWLRMLIQRDLKEAQIIATMKLTQIRNSSDRKTATIAVTVRSTGSQRRADGTESAGSIDLTGTMLVNLTTMLDESLELTGTIVSTTGDTTDPTTLNLPVTLRITKSFVNQP